ncbi:MAG TPA: hypothetical protein DIW17_06355 [Clostridiales bacterium]|nr:serine hydrolase [Clostridia bacterium]HCS73478.1 hypothetical protein [Clostridiales bacterium]
MALESLRPAGVGEIFNSDSLNEPFCFPSDEVHPYIAQTIIRHMLMMATPHESTTYSRMDMNDWVKTFFICEPSHMLGMVFSYDTSSIHVLGALVERISGVPFLEYLHTRLLEPLGFTSKLFENLNNLDVTFKDDAGKSQERWYMLRRRTHVRN